MVRIYLNLVKHFTDDRANSYISIPPEVKTIEDLRKHIVQVFDIWLDFSLFKEKKGENVHFLLKTNESVTILTENDTVWVKPYPIQFDNEIPIESVPVAKAEEILREYPKSHTIESFILDVMPDITDGSQMNLIPVPNSGRSFTNRQLYKILVQGSKKKSEAHALGRRRMIVHLAVPPAENDDLVAKNYYWIYNIVYGIFVLLYVISNLFLASIFF